MKLYGFLLLIFGMILLVGCGKGNVGTRSASSADKHGVFLQIGEVKFTVEVVRDLDEQIKGLAGRESLGKDEGMLFVYDTSEKRDFWMKGMKFPLDIIFINDEVVVDLVEDLPVPAEGEETVSYESKERCDMVLEVDAGTADEQGIEKGDEVDILW